MRMMAEEEKAAEAAAPVTSEAEPAPEPAPVTAESKGFDWTQYAYQ